MNTRLRFVGACWQAIHRAFHRLPAGSYKSSSIAVGAILCGSALAQSSELSLAGPWQVSLHDPRANTATAPAAAWQPIALPGTLDDAGIGEPLALKPELNLRVLTRLQRKHSYVGPAWYRREVTIPAEWAGRRIVLELERVLWESRVFVDGRAISRADSLSVPHRHDLSAALPPGKHELLLQIDNREIHRDVSHHIPRYEVPENMAVAHAYTNHTQTMWNGALGFVRLRAEERVAIERIAVTPRLGAAPGVSLEVAIKNPETAATRRTLVFALRRADRSDAPALAELRREIDVAAGGGTTRIDWPLPAGTAVEPWDEFTPVLYRIEASFAGESATVSTSFGFREIAAREGELQLNGHRIFLRGNLECAIFPLTGYPPTDVAAWRKLIGEAKRWGLNHLRFHSWCPPRAAFTAADELGVYLQIELPHWSAVAGKDEPTWAFLQAEADRMIAEYGNHPSFVFLSLGNELQGDFEKLNGLVRQLRERDARRLYATTTFTFQKDHGRAPEPADDFFVTQYTKEGWVRGQGVFNDKPPAFDTDYRVASAKVAVPLVAHEIGQYAVYPDLREIARYTGHLVPLNFIAVRDDLAKKGLLPLAPQFTAASGRFATLLYKEEIERALRTPQFDGFQLLQLQDFPGQGTALVGLLNAFWETKCILTPEEFREACAPLVPLARFPKAVYERGETFAAKIEVANFFHTLPAAELAWTLRDARAGAVIAEGKIGPVALPLGNGREVGTISVPIPTAGEAARWQLEVAVRGTEFRNRWNVWVYPRARENGPGAADDVPAGVRLATTLADAQRALAAGERVIFAPPPAQIAGIPGKFVPVFWSPVHFPKQPGTMGLLVDPAHPALRAFPTDSHSDWQWWDPTLRSKSIVLDGLGAAPIVRVIDNFNRNHSLANVFEARVGEGRLLFCAIDITSELATRPVARQLRASLLRYAASADFAPHGTLTPEQLAALMLDSNSSSK